MSAQPLENASAAPADIDVKLMDLVAEYIADEDMCGLRNGHLLLPNNTGWRGNGHVSDEHVDVVRLEVSQGGQGGSPRLPGVHQVRHREAVQARLLVIFALPARRVPTT